MTKLYPPRTRLNDNALIAVWGQMPEAMQRELLRLEWETMRGIAIVKDRMMGRQKYDLAGFYGLELLDEEVYRLEQVSRKSDDLAEARAKASEQRAKLADDEQFISERMREMEKLEPFAQEFAKEGKTLAQKIGEYVALENELRSDLLGGIFAVCEFVGADPIQMLTNIRDRPAEAVH